MMHVYRQLLLASLFAALYFAQGVAEPTEGLIAQPVRSLLMHWKFSVAESGSFVAWISLPWSLKPLFGLLSDFVPLFGSRRKSYLIVSTGMAGLALLVLFFVPPTSGQTGWLFGWLLIATIGVAFSDVVIDALMIETGQPLGLTGRLQSVQWTAMYAALILTGPLGGFLSEHKLQSWGFLICGVMILPTVPLVLLGVRELPQLAAARPWRDEVNELVGAMQNPTLRAVAGFLLLWNFNPFTTVVLQSFMNDELGWNESFYGQTVMWLAIGSIVGSLAYGLYCRRVPMPLLFHGAIVFGILATISYWFMATPRSAIVVSVAVGFTYMTANMIQFDLAARVCPLSLSGTVFATLMAVTNLGMTLSYWAGGHLYAWCLTQWDRATAFRVLVGIGAGTTAACWTLVPRLKRAIVSPGAQGWSSGE